ncbi:MAG: hypothetical protein KC731_14545 [Myxococcales bacterium]|nr:hypothetical protein [Myxococcales bacterium]
MSWLELSRRRVGALALSGLVAACGGTERRAAPPSPPPTAPPPPTAARAEASWVAELAFAGGKWTVTYRFPTPQRAVLFDTAHGDYRRNHWSAEQSGVSLESLHGLDGMFFEAPTSTVRLSVEVPSEPTEGTLAFIPFSDGSHAIWGGQLALLTIEDRAAAEALEGDLRRWHGEQPPVEIRATSERPLLGPDGPGATLSGRAQEGGGPFFYTGPIDDPELILDRGLPGWVRDAFEEQMPRVRATLEAAWSERLEPPQLMLAWGGGAGPWSNRGRAEGRQIAMLIAGADYLERSDARFADLVWFFAHEWTHRHQFVADGDGDAWMIEGFADTLATDVLVRVGLWGKGDLERRYWSVARECARLLAGRRLSESKGRIAYVCGDLVGVALMAVLPDHDLPALWKAARTAAGGRVTRATLLQAARERGAAEDGVTIIDDFVSGLRDDTDRAIRDMLEGAKLDPSYRDGSLSSMAFPHLR